VYGDFNVKHVYPPCTFCLANDSSGRDINIELKLYWQRVECHLRWSGAAGDLDLDGGVQYAIQPYYNIGIIPFRGFVSSGSFLTIILHSFSWSR
jgi:hypothetical protein